MFLDKKKKKKEEKFCILISWNMIKINEALT